MAREARSSGAGRRSIPVAVAVVLACIVTSAWVTFDRVGAVIRTREWVAHTWQVKAGLETVYGTVVTAESDMRAYFTTGDESMLANYTGSQEAAHRQIETLRELTRDNYRQKPNLDLLRIAIDGRYDKMRHSVAVRRANSLESAIVILRQDNTRQTGPLSMKAVRDAIQDCNNEESRLLKLRQDRDAGETAQAEFSFLVTVVIGVFLISAFGVLSNRLVRQRDEAAEEERAFRDDLEREVARTRAAEARLQATAAELRRSNEELQNFAFVASHDLQEPLRKIRAFSDRVRRRAGTALDDESKDSLQRVEAAANRMQTLILDLLELSRVTTKVRPQVLTNLAQTIDEVADDLQARLDDSGGQVVHGALPEVIADPAQLRQLLQNLIANALKFRREGVPPVVTVEGALRPDGRAEIAVRDNGIGFEEKYADRIFIVFQRLHGRGEYEGSGIGLAIVRKIVERHGGSIQAEGRPGEGATFRFDLPSPSSAPMRDATLESGEGE